MDAKAICARIHLICRAHKGAGTDTMDASRVAPFINLHSHSAKDASDFEAKVKSEVSNGACYVVDYTCKEPGKLAGTVRIIRPLRGEVLIPFSNKEFIFSLRPPK